jgi:hypothetical protein
VRIFDPDQLGPTAFGTGSTTIAVRTARLAVIQVAAFTTPLTI